MSEISIDYTQNPTGTCDSKCFTTEMYINVLNSKINNGKNLTDALNETINDMMSNFNPSNFGNTIINHHIDCFFNSKENIGNAHKNFLNL